MMVQSTVAPASKTRKRGNITPSRDEIESWLSGLPVRPRYVPIFREVMADTETPVSAFLKIRRDAPAFLLESVEGGQRIARYSFIGSEPFLDITLNEDEATVVSADSIRKERYTDPLTFLSSELAWYDSARMGTCHCRASWAGRSDFSPMRRSAHSSRGCPRRRERDVGSQPGAS